MNANGFNLSALVKFLGRDDWALQFEEVMGDHFWPVMDEFGLDHEEIGEVLGDHWAMTLWGCAFEDFLTQVFEPDGRTFVDIFLKSRGFKETARSKTYLKAISTSVISLYEVCEIVPGKSFLARDLLRGGDPVTVSEGTATQTLRQWEKIAARIVEVGGTNIITGGILPYSPEASEALLEGLREMSGKKRSRKKLILDNDTLRPAAPLFTHAWLFDTLPRVLGEVQPFICNSDGDNIVFHEVRFPLEVGITEKDIADRFAGLDDLRQENPQFWNWLGRPPAMGPARPEHPNALVAGVTLEDGTPVLGNLEIKGRFLVLMVNSAERAQRGAELVQNILGKMVRTPLSAIQTIEQLKAAHQGRRPSADDIPPEVATPLVHAMLDKQYRATLDQPVAMLGDISPRAAARTKDGRLKVADWLKYLELRSSAGPNPQGPMATYDFLWLWKELSIEDLRR
ncbi:hypothetical protein [Sinorhizobium meliloti]|nr:hypothetical protein U8C39_11460 [Sinorhizobium meliloti]WQP09151.1 hypothetical protein U8C39_37245 [Sinorhizobium meliloti]WQP09352.1 hypothetical protein U8C39_37660 [Sinorhizobium meliloti]WQP09475.1 hypothetical protein U8C39_38550 [Sinorhizobium meliloti]WQP22656.1 hypothetical protein U8C33_36970 [Sinorhizobium meliloti]